MTTETLDPIAYVRLPRLDTAAALSLGKMLLMLAPKNLGTAAREGLEGLHGSLVHLQKAWNDAAEIIKRLDLRPLDRRVDALFGVVRDRLDNYRVLKESPDRTRALLVLDTVFPEGLAFLKWTFLRQHAEGERRLAIIARHDFNADLVRFVGEVFVTELRQAQAEYGAALGITAPLELVPEQARVLEPLRAFVDAVADYAIHLLSMARSQRERTAEIRHALSPIELFRKAAETSTADAASDVPAEAPTAETPVPPLPVA